MHFNAEHNVITSSRSCIDFEPISTCDMPRHSSECTYPLVVSAVKRRKRTQMSFSEIDGSLQSRRLIFQPLDFMSHSIKPAIAFGALSSILAFVTLPNELKISGTAKA